MPDRPLLPATVPAGAATPSDLQRRAEDRWRKDRRDALAGFVGSALFTWAIWLATAWAAGDIYFPWPLIVNAFALMNLFRVATNRTRDRRLRGQAAGAQAGQGDRGPEQEAVRAVTRAWAALRHHPSGVLLVGQLLVVLAYPFLDDLDRRAARSSASSR